MSGGQKEGRDLSPQRAGLGGRGGWRVSGVARWGEQGFPCPGAAAPLLPSAPGPRASAKPGARDALGREH